MSKATYDMLLDWAESQLGDFDAYDNLSELEADLSSAPSKAKHVDGRAAHAKKLLEDWFNEKIDVKGYNAEEIKGAIIDNESRDIMQKVDSAKTERELDNIDLSGIGKEAKEQAESLIEGKKGELLESGMEVVEREFREALAAGTPDEGVETPYSMREIRDRFGKEFASKMSEAVAERTEQLFDQKQARQ